MSRVYPNYGATVVATSSDLPSASAGLEGLMFYVKDSNKVVVCSGSSWVEVSDLDNTNAFSEAASDLNNFFSAWTSFTPTLSGGSWAAGNGTFSTAYIKVGKLVVYRGRFVFGSTTVKDASNGLSISVPVTMASTVGLVGSASYLDSGVANFMGLITPGSTTTINPQAVTVSGSSVQHSGVVTNNPFTWATNDEIRWTVTYEGA